MASVIDLSGRTALVTGATSGIGRACAVQLAADGAAVIVHGRDAERGGAAVSEIEAAGGEARFIKANLADIAETRRLAEEAGPVDILVNNAGLLRLAPTAEFDLDLYEEILATNARAGFILVGALAPGMVERGEGSIINVSSQTQQLGLAGTAAYAGSKGAQLAMTRAWAAEYSGGGVRVNAITPGPTWTGDPAPKEFMERLAASTAVGRVADAEEIAQIVSFLASPRASYITGSVYPIDGGSTAIHNI
jgi:NAD(P)-dependent dehydrogenase (short-subunit alcohol dehydrogenase family)